MATETVAARPWLDELNARYGETRVKPGPVKLHGEDGSYVRECWAWFPGARNHNVAIDRYGSHWVVRAASPSRRAQFEVYGGGEPTAAQIRAVLVLAGMLEEKTDD